MKPIVGALDVLTSKSSTLPYDDETMQKMIKLVQKAKSTRYAPKENRVTDLQSRGKGR